MNPGVKPLPPGQQAIWRILRSHYPAEVASDVIWERLPWMNQKTIKAQMWHLRQRLTGWTIVGTRGSGQSYRLVKNENQ